MNEVRMQAMEFAVKLHSNPMMPTGADEVLKTAARIYGFLMNQPDGTTKPAEIAHGG